MFGFLKQLFKKDNTKTMNNNSSLNESVQTPGKAKFFIELYDEVVNDNDQVTYKKVKSDEPLSFEASSKQEVDSYLAKFKLCGQRAKIIKVIPPSNATPAPNSMPQAASPTSSQPISTSQPIQNTNPIKIEELQTPVVRIAQPIKYYKVGDIDIKDDNGKLYQKQWMKLSDAEASNLRVINDKNNQLVNLTGKHFEMKKWILVENTADETSSLEDSLK